MNVLRCIHPLVFAAAAGTTLAAGAAGQVEITFVHETRYTDAGLGEVERARTERSLAEYLQGLGPRLPDGQVLALEITDIDLAGWQTISVHPVRVLRGGADWPRIALRYELREQGRALKAGSANLADMNYLQTLRRLPDTDLPYEKRMLADWFDETFATP